MPPPPLLLPLAPAYAVFDFQNNQDGLNDPKGKFRVFTCLVGSVVFCIRDGNI